jgi:hypothetical protein
VGSTSNIDLTALVTLLGGSVSGVVVGTDLDALDERGQAFVAQQGCNADYELCDVEALPGSVGRRVDVQALALEAVDMMGDVFWDADEYAAETLACPECEEDIPVLSESCPRCGAIFDEPLSKSQRIYEDAVACVATAIRKALATSLAAGAG